MTMRTAQSFRMIRLESPGRPTRMARSKPSSMRLTTRSEVANVEFDVGISQSEFVEGRHHFQRAEGQRRRQAQPSRGDR